MINDDTWFYESQDCNVKVHTAESQHQIIDTKRGKLHLALQNHKILHIGDVHCSPKLTNVLSLSRLLNKGFTIRFSNPNAQIYTQRKRCYAPVCLSERL